MNLSTAEQNNKEEVDNEIKTVILAGATGALGELIAKYLLQRGARVTALVRKENTKPVVTALQEQGVIVKPVDFNNINDLKEACVGGSCVVSALSGLHNVIVDVQTNVLTAAVAAGVPRFIPSDYCIDFTKLPKGSNRNLDLRREFKNRLDAAPIAATSILNGMFTDLLTGQAPVILFGLKRVAYWGNADQLLDFTSMNDTAAFTAAAALDPKTPRFLRIAGEVSTIKGLQQSASKVSGKKFGLLRIGGLGMLQTMIKLTRTLLPKNEEVFPPWQGMQYLHNMFTGLPKLDPLDNDRYPEIRWTTIKEVLQSRSE